LATGLDSPRPDPVELDIIKSFGWAILVTEELLYERFLHISAKRSAMTQDQFRKHLRQMEAKGFVSEENLHGKRAFRLLVIPDRIDRNGRPQTPLDEMRLVAGSLAARMKIRREDRGTPEKETPTD
jgi:hypothetical protein